MGITRSAITLFAVAVFALALAACGGGDDGGVKPVGSGTTSGSPYQITEPGNLTWMAKNVSGSSGRYFELMNDIDLEGKGWAPIGSYLNPFRGNFNGGGFKISGLHINRPADNDVGLFGWIDVGEVKDLTVEIASGGVIGLAYVGGIAGGVDLGGRINNCVVTGNVRGNSIIGGIAGVVGFNGIGSINDSSFTGNVISTATEPDEGVGIGGIAGAVGFYNAPSSTGNINRCYAIGNVSGQLGVGGIAGAVGVDTGATGYVNDCYSTADVIGIDGVGGIAGVGGFDLLGGGSGVGNINRCYATGDITGDNGVGGIAGLFVNGGVSNCAALNSVISGSGAGFGRVAGDSGTLSNNVARSSMTVPGGATSSLNGIHGYSISAGDISNSATYSDSPPADTGGLGWNFTSIWKWWDLGPTPEELPLLR